ncbi:hypothetical protein [Thiothrix subterranea]|uniref:hypothetical protein n=1 Tax=Thiothrix subterranea TaxID=2735563 RepID=UPI00280B3179|nr:hypothetical protein [Thiothrix subterranea]
MAGMDECGDAWRQEVGSRAMQRIQQGYNIQTITDQYQKTYQRLVEDQQMSRMTLVTHLP